MTDQHVQVVKHVVDTLSATAILGTFVGFLPPLAAFVAVLWYALQIWESDTVQGWLHRHRVQHRLRRKHRRRVAHGRPTPPKLPRPWQPPRGNPPFGNE